MDTKKRKRIILVVIVILLLPASTILINHGVNYMRTTIPLHHFSKLIAQGKINDLDLTIYYMNPNAFTFFPIPVEGLISSYEEEKIVISGRELKEHIDLFKQLSNVDLKLIWKKSLYEDVRIYYIFETEGKSKIFDVAMWGYNGGILVNGVEVKENDIFYDVIIPFLPEDAVKQLERYIGRGNREETADHSE